MDDKKSELLQYAREYATAGKDLYELLSVSADAAQPEVHRAWRKASLKHHPDKAKNFDPEIWQLFERARDVLSSPEARAAYDSARAAALQAQRARAALDAKRRAMIDDLEARERGVKRKVDGDEEEGKKNMMTQAEKRALMEKGREHLEKRRRLKEEAEARERAREAKEREHAPMERGGDAARKEAKPEPEPDTTATSADIRMEDADAQPPPPAAAAADGYDERIADIERRLRERKADKAARKADKKKNGGRPQKDETSKDGKPTAIPAAAPEKPASVPRFKINTTQPPTSNAAPGDFSSTMAKLRAAQREKERKRAEAEAAAAASTAMASDGI